MYPNEAKKLKERRSMPVLKTGEYHLGTSHFLVCAASFARKGENV